MIDVHHQEQNIETTMEKAAQVVATACHKGQTRKNKTLPYIVHPAQVVEHLKEIGYTHHETLAIGWLHDVVEDSTYTTKQIEQQFGKNVAQGVGYLTRDLSNQKYKERLLKAPRDVQIVKLCDLLDNVKSLNDLSRRGKIKKIKDSKEFYLPLARKIHPDLGKRIEHQLNNYKEFRNYTLLASPS